MNIYNPVGNQKIQGKHHGVFIKSSGNGSKYVWPDAELENSKYKLHSAFKTTYTVTSRKDVTEALMKMQFGDLPIPELQINFVE